MKIDINRAEKTLADYDDLISSAIELIDQFNRLDIWNDYQKHINRKFTASKKLIEAYEASGLYNSYDILRIAGFVATEESLSNAVASLLDPNRPHQLGIVPLKSLLTSLRNRKKETISAILKILDDPWIKIKVQRELHLRNTIPDIVIESKDFIIFIENKLRGNVETGNGTQTIRQWEALKLRGQRYGISNLLGIFLTPEGKSPSSKDFIPLSVHELVSALRKVLEKPKAPDHMDIIYAFLGFYDWHDC